MEGETRITGARKPIQRVVLEPADAEPLPDALRAITEADVITLGPGSLFTSLVPNLLAKEVVDTIRESSATKIYIQNIMTQPGETTDYRVGDHIQKLIEHSNGRLLFPNVIINSGVPSAEVLRRYEEDGSTVVRFNRDNLATMGIRIMERDLLAEDRVIRHDPDRLARAILEMTGLARAHHHA
jgi:uncharacterized cofD-like protein